MENCRQCGRPLYVEEERVEGVCLPCQNRHTDLIIVAVAVALLLVGTLIASVVLGVTPW